MRQALSAGVLIGQLGRWLQGRWTEAQLSMDITLKELYAIIMAVHTWGSLWQRKRILFHCDNQAVVDIWESGCTRASKTMALVRLLYFAAARYNINVCIVHIDGANNVIADCLSRFKLDRFKQLAPLANPAADNIDPVLHRSLLQCCYSGVAPSTR